MITALTRAGVTKLFPQLLAAFTLAGTFYFFAAVLAVTCVYGYMILPENKGQSLVKTEDKFVKTEDGKQEEEMKSLER